MLTGTGEKSISDSDTSGMLFHVHLWAPGFCGDETVPLTIGSLNFGFNQTTMDRAQPFGKRLRLK